MSEVCTVIMTKLTTFFILFFTYIIQNYIKIYHYLFTMHYLFIYL